MLLKVEQHKTQVKMSIIATSSSNSKLLDYDDKQRIWRSSPGVAYERPLIAVPFKWEAEPGVPKLNKGLEQSSPNPKLAPPPRLRSDFQKDNAAAAAANSKPSPLLSPRSPRSISLSKKMRSLLQGKLSNFSNSRRISDERMSSTSPYGSERSQESSSSSSSLFWEAMGDSDSADTEESVHMHVKHMVYNAGSFVPLGDSDHIVLEGEQLNLRMDDAPRSSDFSDPPPVQQQSFMPFKNMSTMLLELWYGGNVSSGILDSSSGGHHQINFDISPASSSSSDSVESPGSYNSSSSFSSDYDNHPPPPQHFKPGFGKDDDYDQLPKKFQDMDFDEHDYRDEDFSIDFDSYSSDFLLAEKHYYKSDRFRVESSESASLCGPSEDKQESVHERLSSVQLQPLPSALKSGKRASNRNSMKRVRFADDDAQPSPTESEEQEVACSTKFSPALERYSSRPATRFSDDDDAEDNLPSAAEDESSSYSSPSPSPRPRRDLSELFMQIVQADAEITRRQKRGAFKSMFRSTKRY